MILTLNDLEVRQACLEYVDKKTDYKYSLCEDNSYFDGYIEDGVIKFNVEVE